MEFIIDAEDTKIFRSTDHRPSMTNCVQNCSILFAKDPMAKRRFTHWVLSLYEDCGHHKVEKTVLTASDLYDMM